MGQHATDLDIDKLIAKSEEDFPEFLELLTSAIGDPSPSEDEMRKAFKVFDSRGKGFVSFEEMEFAVNKFMSSNENELDNTGGNPPGTACSHYINFFDNFLHIFTHQRTLVSVIVILRLFFFF